jgi:hypothetical protein
MQTSCGKSKILSLVIVLLGSLFVVAPQSVSAASNNCSKIGIVKVVGQQSFRCTRGSGGLKVWVKVKTSKLPNKTTASCAKGGKCALGDLGPGGGKVFFVSMSYFASPGSDCGSKCLYLEAAPKDLGYFQWCSDITTFFGSTASAIGTGMSNTMAAASTCKFGAIREVANYQFGNRSDWFLPSKDELIEMVGQSSILGNLEFNYYWSSTERDGEAAWSEFATGRSYGQDVSKDYPSSVRAVRAF